MSKGTIGTSTGMIVNANSVKAIKCNCRTCFHSVNKKGILYCEYYSLVEPKKQKCARYSYINRSGKKQKPLTKEQKEKIQGNKVKSFPWEIG